MSAALVVVDRAAAWSGLLWLGRRMARRSLTILTYHRVLDESPAAGDEMSNLVVRRDHFAAQAAWLARNARVVTVSQGLASLARDDRSDRPLVAMTFDDGYADSATNAAPILEAHGIRGTFFVASGFVAGESLWFDRASAFLRTCPSGPRRDAAAATLGAEGGSRLRTLDRWLGWLKSMPADEREGVLRGVGATGPVPGCEPMTPEQIRVLADMGHEIGAHTVTHPILPREPAERVRDELVRCRSDLESWTGAAVVGFCYPNGRWSEGVRAAVADAGYAYATTTRRGVVSRGNDAFTLCRRWVASDTSTLGGCHDDAMFAAEVLGLHDFIRDRLGRPRGPAGNPPASRAVRPAA